MDPLRLVELLSQEEVDTAARQEYMEADRATLVQQLLEVIEAAQVEGEGGWAPIHAAEWLGELHATEAVSPLLALLNALEDDAALFDSITSALAAMRAAVVEPVLAAYQDCTSADVQGAYLEILVQSGTHDPRILPLLLHFLDEEPEYAAGLLALYNDPSACGPLAARLDNLSMPADDPDLVAETVAELALAIEQLGGTLTAEQQAKYAVAQRLTGPVRLLGGDGPSSRV